MCTSDKIAQTLLNGISRFAHKLVVIKYLEDNLMQIVFGITIYYRYAYNITGTYNWQKWNIINNGDETLTASNNFNADNLHTGIYTINMDRTITSLLTEYPNHYKWGTLSCNSAKDFGYQIYIPDLLFYEDKGIYLRTYYENETNLKKWRNWECIHINDYKSKSIAANGWIIFHNGLIIQWGNTLVYTRNKISDNVVNVMDTTNPNYIVFPLSLSSFSHSGWDYQHILLEHTTNGNDNLTTAKIFGEIKKSTTGFIVNTMNFNIMNFTVVDTDSISLNWSCMSFV